ncbi:Origin recognition complex subunit 2 [Coemansia sp. IMI 209128]|nr:Origin recognition complex subunit 2 [Coemansia sp. IMI 209128]
MADETHGTPRTGPRARDRVDMGLTLTTTRKGRKTLLTDSSIDSPSRLATDITDILKLSAAVDADDKENSSEENANMTSVIGQAVYGFQKRATRGRGSSSPRGSTRSTRARRGGGGGGTVRASRLRASTTVNDDEDEDCDEGDDDDEAELPPGKSRRRSDGTRQAQTPARRPTATGAQAGDDGEDDGDEEEEEEEMLALELDNDFGHNGPAYERYFQDLHTTKGPKTSDNTLSKLPPLTQSECRTILSKVPVKHKGELDLLEKLHRRQFRQWFFEMTCGFNLVFYGYGSKRRLMNSLATELATDAPAVIINGFFPTLNLKQSLEKVVSEVIGIGDTTGTVADLASLIHGYFESKSREVKEMYFVVHNIDGPCLRKHQAALAVLASSPSIHLLASIDHIEAPLIWDSSTTTRFNWAWHDLTTFEPYTVETSYENFASDTTEIGPRGVLHVLASLTENTKSIFRILAEYQIAESVMGDAATKMPAMAYSAYFAACRDQFLVSSELTFRSQLTEFRDHKVIQSRHAADGTESVHIPLDAATLGTILEGMD